MLKALALTLTLTFMAGAVDARPVLLELFTSENCPSCPAAEKVVNELNQREDAFALSYHVDYWDYPNKKDKYALPESKERHQQYIANIGQKRVYTPQIFIDVNQNNTGSWTWRVKQMISKAKKDHLPFKINVESGEQKHIIHIPENGYKTQADLWLVTYKIANNKVNTRRKHTNVVRKVENIGTWDGSDLTLTTQLNIPEKHKAVLILQQKGLRDILAIKHF